MAIGVCVWHKLSDAKSTLDFVDNWALGYRADLKISAAASPSFEMASCFPLIQHPWIFPDPYKNVVTTRVVFNAEKIEELKVAAAGPFLDKLTSVEAVSAFIWRRLIEATKRKDGSTGGGEAVVDRCFASHPLPPRSFGNGFVKVMAVTEGDGGDYHCLALKLREEFRKVDGDYVRKFEDRSMFSVKEESDEAAKERKVVEFCIFTGWWRLPAAVATLVAAPVRNTIVLMGTNSGDGIEAWINLDADEIAFVDLGL